MPFGLGKKTPKGDAAASKEADPASSSSSDHSTSSKQDTNSDQPSKAEPVTHLSQEDRLKSQLKNMIPLELSLDGNKLTMGGEGSWELQETEAVKSRARIEELEEIVKKKDAEMSSLNATSSGSSNAMNALQFKLEVLLDMLSISRADVTQTERMLEKEKIVSDEYRKELERVLGVCEEKGFDVGTIGGS
jgi:acetolactate synthase regulatory subunit